MTSSSDLHSMALRIGLLRPERLLAFIAKGFILGRLLNARSKVDAFIASTDVPRQKFDDVFAGISHGLT